MTARKRHAVKPVKAWANLTARGKINTGLISSVKSVMEARAKIPRRERMTVIPVLIAPLKRGKQK